MWRGGIYYAASEQSVLEVDVLESGKICKRKGMSDFDKGQIVMTRRLGQSLGYFISDGVLYITDGRPCTWERDGSRMHYGKKANWPRQCDVLLRNLGSWSSCGCCLDTCHLPQSQSQSVYCRIHQISSAQRNSYDLAANIYAVDGIQQVTQITYTKITYTRNNI